jgi:hypothetical protein
MAALKLKKYPKKPKASASLETINNFFRRCKEVDAENSRIKREHAAHEAAAKKLKNFRPGKSKVGTTHRRKKAAPKKAAHKKAAKRRR